MNALRRRRLRKMSAARKAGGFPLTLAGIIVALEAFGSAFALPLLVLGLFTAFAWLGVFTALFPWAHLIVLVAFTAWFFVALRQAKQRYRKPSRSLARRRLEAANRLKHRPLDAIEDRPIITHAGQREAWAAHVAQNRAQLNNLKPPRWGLSFADRDPYALRYAMVILLAVGLCFSWGGWGNRLLAALDPAISMPWRAAPLTLNAWITPPGYTGLPPMMIATPAGLRHTADVIDVPEGSVLSVHLVDSRRAPVLTINGTSDALTPDDHGDLVATRTITAGNSITLQRRWSTLGSWKMRVIPDQAPQISLAEPPTVTERKATRLSYEASDDYGVQSVSVKLTPTMTLPGAKEESVTLPLTASQVKHIKQADYQDLTELSWAGLPVTIQMAATDAAGHTSLSEPAKFTLPERSFNNPLARALIEERKKLLDKPDDAARNEAANVMASIARQPINYRGDPVVMMALRSGAVRLVLDREDSVIPSVRGLLWQAALKIEDGNVSTAQDMLRQAQKELASALERNASEAEIQQLIDKLQAALAQYLQQLATRNDQQQPDSGIERMMGAQVNVLTPEDLRKMLDTIRNNSATGSREEAQKQLAKLQQILENIRTTPPQLSAEQKQMLMQMKGLHDLAQEQQKLLDKTFESQRNGETAKQKGELSEEQNGLLSKLKSLMPKKGGAEPSMRTGSKAMESATGDLKQGDGERAMKRQGEAIAAMQRSLEAMIDKIQQDGEGEEGQGLPGGNRDPFGRSAGRMSDDGSVKVPEQMNIQRAKEILDELQRRAGDGQRPKLERDYIDRLLQRF